MGFMGIKHWSESDCAADFHARLRLQIRNEFRKEITNKANEYNTPGYVNALLLFKEYPSLVKFIDAPTLKKINDGIDKDLGYLKGKDGVDLIRNFYAECYLTKEEK